MDLKDFKGKVAVITGAASGIGLAIANRCAKEGMKVVLADIEEEALNLAEEGIKPIAPITLSIRTDVSKASEVESLAREVFDTLGEVHILCNNAGVTSGGEILMHTLNDWKWVLGVNLMGVVHGILYFLPKMLEQPAESHVINTGSGYSLVPGYGAYGVSKFGIIAITEMLFNQLKSSKVKVSILMPGLINTQIEDAERNRPDELRNPTLDPKIQRRKDRKRRFMKKYLATGMAPEQVADIMFDGIRQERLYILTDTGHRNAFVERMNGILNAIDSLPRLDNMNNSK
ncbi:MAG: SDR family NAD(P)-dependent oxidoreductase [Candidatus Hodarchaeota archaeon]